MPLRQVTANGLRFSFHEEGRGPLVLLLHGFPDTPETWAEVQPALAALGYRTVAPFMRGYPPTEAPADGDYSLLRLGADVLALIEALGETRAVVVGHDWGAFAAYAAANLDPSRLAKLVTLAIPHPGALRFSLASLVKSSHFITFQLRARALKRLRRDDFAEVGAICRKWSPTWRPSDADLAPVKRCLGSPGGLEGALGYYWSFRADLLGRRGAEARRVARSKTSVPTLAFFGDLDGALDLAAIDRAPALFTGPYEAVRIPTAGHFMHREAPQLVLAKMRAFLGSEPG